MDLTIMDDQTGTTGSTDAIHDTESTVVHAVPIHHHAADDDDAVPSISAVALPVEQDGVPLAIMEPVPSQESDESTERRPSIICVTVRKSGRGGAVGLTIENSEEGLRISDIDAEGPFYNTPLETGGVLLSVNNSSCELKDAKYVTRLIRRSKGSVTLVVHRPEDDPFLMSTTVIKPEPTSKVGIGVQIYDGDLRVSSIDPQGLFGSLILSVGDKVVSICGISCACMDSSSAIELIRKEKRIVTIVTWTKEEAGVVVATAKAAPLYVRYRSFLPCLFSVMLVTSIALIVMLTSRGKGEPTSDGPCRNLYGQPIPYC